MDARWRGVIAGIAFCKAMQLLYAAAIGMEDHLEVTKHLWMEWYISVPIGVVLLVVVAVATAPDPKKGESSGRED